jgi:catechol-2,3-dioxygenase
MNHHDLGLFATPTNSRPPLGTPGLYHLAWEVPRIEDLAAARDILTELGALIGESDHGATKSLYGQDPDGNEFEVMWLVPRADWGAHEHSAVIERLDMDRELARFGGKNG